MSSGIFPSFLILANLAPMYLLLFSFSQGVLHHLPHHLLKKKKNYSPLVCFKLIHWVSLASEQSFLGPAPEGSARSTAYLFSWRSGVVGEDEKEKKAKAKPHVFVITFGSSGLCFSVVVFFCFWQNTTVCLRIFT